MPQAQAVTGIRKRGQAALQSEQVPPPQRRWSGGTVSSIDWQLEGRRFVSRRRGASGANVRRGGRLRGDLGVVGGERLLWGDLTQRGLRREEGHPEERAFSQVTVSWEPATTGDGLRVDVLNFVIDALSLLRERWLGVNYDLEPTTEDLGKFMDSLAEP